MASRLRPELGPDAIRLSTDAQDLSDCLWEMHRALLEVMSCDDADRSLAGMHALRHVALIGLEAAQAVPPSPPRIEVAVLSWLTEHGIDGQGVFSPAFIQARLGSRFLEDVLDSVGMATFAPVLRWLSLTIEVQLLLDSLYSFLDEMAARLEADVDQRAAPPTPALLVGLHDLLSSTLALLPRRARTNVESLSRRKRVTCLCSREFRDETYMPPESVISATLLDKPSVTSGGADDLAPHGCAWENCRASVKMRRSPSGLAGGPGVPRRT